MDKYKIYPKQYRNEKITIQKNKCFVLMQFSSDLDIVYGTIKKELDDIGFICHRADDISGSPIIFNKILTEMFSSRFIIAELTYENPNVFYELGIAHSFKESSNIIIIKQKSDTASTYPFDLKHLQYIEYTTDNLKLLTAQIKDYINSNKYLTDFYEILNIKDIIPFVSDNQEEFVEYITTLLENDIIIITELLNNELVEFSLNEIESVFRHYENIIQTTINNNRFDVLNGVLKIYFELIYNCQYVQVSEIYLNSFINKDWGLPESVSWKVDLLYKLVFGKKLLHICLPWIIDYFSVLRSTNIDLNRYQLERLLLTCNYDEVNKSILNALYSPNFYIREVMADLIGEKRIRDGLEILYNRLAVEDHIYVSRSIVEAIGKIDDISGIDRLLNWFESHKSKFDEVKYYGIYNHMTYAIQRMDTSPTKIYFQSFIEKYGDKINIPGL